MCKSIWIEIEIWKLDGYEKSFRSF